MLGHGRCGCDSGGRRRALLGGNLSERSQVDQDREGVRAGSCAGSLTPMELVTVCLVMQNKPQVGSSLEAICEGAEQPGARHT